MKKYKFLYLFLILIYSCTSDYDKQQDTLSVEKIAAIISLVNRYLKLGHFNGTVLIEREVIVNTYQFGNGIFNIVTPTGLVLASLGLVKIGYDKFLKFIFPLYLVLAAVAVIFLSLSIY